MYVICFLVYVYTLRTQPKLYIYAFQNALEQQLKKVPKGLLNILFGSDIQWQKRNVVLLHACGLKSIWFFLLFPSLLYNFRQVQCGNKEL